MLDRSSIQDFAVYRSIQRSLLVGLVAIPFVLIGLDLLLLPKIWPEYVRRFDRLTDVMKLPRITADGPEEPWGFVFLLIGAGMVAWAARNFIFPKPVLRTSGSSLVMGGILGPGSGELHVPLSEIREVAPALLFEEGEREPGLLLLPQYPERLPSSPWGAVWIDEYLVLRASDWDAPPAVVSEYLTGIIPKTGYLVDLDVDVPSLTRVQRDPTEGVDPLTRAAARNTLTLGGSTLAAALLLAGILVLADVETLAWFLIPAALAFAGVWLLTNGIRDSRIIS